MFIDIFEKIVEQHKEKTAYVSGGRRLSYSARDHKARCITAGLLHNGIGTGDRVALRLQSTSDFAACCIAVWRAGGIVVPLDPALPESDLSYFLSISRASLVLVADPDDTLPPGIRSLSAIQLMQYHPEGNGAAWLPDQHMLILFTSGTTGRPRGIVHTCHSTTRMAQRSVEVSGLSQDDVLLATSLASTGFGLHTYILEPLLRGATVVVVHPFHPRIALQTAERESVTRIQTVPVVLKLLLGAQDIELSTLRTIRLGAATLDAQSRERCLEKFGIAPIQGYGMSEVGRIACATHSPSSDPELMTVNTGLEVRIFSDDGDVAVSGQVGEIGVRADSLCQPYYLVENGVREPLPMHQGYFMTGDLGMVSANGQLKLSGRRKGFILTPRYKVDPAEVEDVLMLHPAITDTAVFPVPGKAGYDIIKATVVAEKPLTAGEVMTFCSSRLPQGKCPQLVEFIDQIPRNKLGKVEIGKLRGDR